MFKREFKGMRNMPSLLLGVGDKDLPYKGNETAYNKWVDMLTRCYTDKYPAYKGVTVCEDWLLFSNFKTWFDSQPYTKGMHLDKDIIKVSNKVYSSANCCLVEPWLNMFMSKLYAKGYEVTPQNKFAVRLYHRGNRTNLGNYTTKVEAISKVVAFKSAILEEVITTQTDERVIQGLKKHIERLQDGKFRK